MDWPTSIPIVLGIWTLGLVTGLVIRIGRERSAFNMGIGIGRRQTARARRALDEDTDPAKPWTW